MGKKSLESRIKRIEKFGTHSYTPSWKAVVVDKSGSKPIYFGDCGMDVDEESYLKWLQTLTPDDQLLVVTESIQANNHERIDVDFYNNVNPITSNMAIPWECDPEMRKALLDESERQRKEKDLELRERALEQREKAIHT